MEKEPEFKSTPEKKKKMIKRVCSWCGKVMGEKEGEEGDGEITHGICGECKKKMEEEYGM